MKTKIPLLGRAFGRLTVVAEAETGPGGKARWESECECGGRTVSASYDLLHGHVKSCGCLQREKVSKRNTVHGKCKTPEYLSWTEMIKRCEGGGKNKKWYGDVQICDRWRGSFECFLSDMGQKPLPDYTLERIDNKKGYEPGNCRWATKKDQTRNTSRNRYITRDGRTQCLAAWCEEIGISYSVVYRRLSLGWTEEESLLSPVREVRRADKHPNAQHR